jgi:ABC-type nitrate/sulfonate/bicarbonate transport system substrate-binding protein
VVRADLAAKRGDIGALKGLRLTAAEGPDLALRQMLIGAQVDPDRDLDIVELPGARARDVSFGVFAAGALEKGLIDGFWANAMGAELAVSRGIGKVLIDVRRGDDPAAVRRFTFAGLATTDAFIAREPGAVEAAVRAIVKTQKALRTDPSLAREVGRRKFPPDAADLITRIVERDAAFYDPAISAEAVDGLNTFARSVGHLSRPVSYEQVIAVQFCRLWHAS